jgi:hypothetical protein
MKQMSFGDGEYASKKKQTRRELFLAEMEQVVPWHVFLKEIEPFYPVAGRGRRPYAIQTMLRIHLMQNWFGLSDPAMEEALYEIVSMRRFAGLSLSDGVPDETTILNFRRLIETNELAPRIFDAGQCAPVAQGIAAQARYDRGRHDHRRAELDEECRARARSGDASDEERKPVVLRHEGPHWRGCG